jgi:hypothetical protein
MTGVSRLVGRSAIVVALLAVLVAVVAAPAGARAGPSVRLARQATLVDGGQSVCATDAAGNHACSDGLAVP